MTNSDSEVMRAIVSSLYTQWGEFICKEYDWGWYGKEFEFSKVGEVVDEKF